MRYGRPADRQGGAVPRVGLVLFPFFRYDVIAGGAGITSRPVFGEIWLKMPRDVTKRTAGLTLRNGLGHHRRFHVVLLVYTSLFILVFL